MTKLITENTDTNNLKSFYIKNIYKQEIHRQMLAVTIHNLKDIG
ncbi:hypothetical protein F7308_1761 [Francisella salina]|uniref:Uncharacterized protein n=1 Tax=Francisella salina TaxID=573569 RepID=A0ABN3ZS78_FRAST|nr:hypothetical protein F7308_1761 [Francisella salina]